MIDNIKMLKALAHTLELESRSASSTGTLNAGRPAAHLIHLNAGLLSHLARACNRAADNLAAQMDPPFVVSHVRASEGDAPLEG